MSKNPYVQVALTYGRAIGSSARAGFLIVGGFILVLYLIASLVFFFRFGSPVLLLVLAAGLLVCIAVHSKEQFAAPRSRLMPDFRRVHATVAGVAAVVLSILLPALLTLLAGSHSVGLVAIMVSLFGAILWLVLLPNTGLMWLLIALLMMLSSRLESLGLTSLWSGRLEPQAFLLLLAGAVATVLGGVRLLRLDEETWGYPSETRSGSAMKSRMAGDAETDEPTLMRRLSLWLNDAQMARLARHAQRARASRWSSVCRWQVGMTVGWPGWLTALGEVVFLLMLCWMMGAARVAVVLLLLGSIITPASSLMGTLSQRLRTLGYELLMPVARSAYLRQLGAALVLGHIHVWVVTNVAVIICWLIALREPLPTVGVVSILVISAMFQVFLFGAAALLSLHGSEVLGVATMIVAAVPLLLTWAASQPLAEWQYTAMGVMGLFAAIGLLFTYAAYHRWLVADFD